MASQETQATATLTELDIAIPSTTRTDGPDFDQPRGPRQDHHGRNDNYDGWSRGGGDGGHFQSNQRDNDDRSLGRRNEHSDHMERNGGYKREESDSFNNRNNGNRFVDEARGYDPRSNPRDRNFRPDFPERERYREQNGRDGGRHSEHGYKFDDSGSPNGRTSSDISGGERQPSIRGYYALEPPTKRNRPSEQQSYIGRIFRNASSTYISHIQRRVISSKGNN